MPWESCAANPPHFLSLHGNSKHIPRNQIPYSSQLCAASLMQRKRRKVFFHRAVESLMLVGTSQHHPVQPVLKAGSARAVCPGLNSCKDGKSTTSLGSQHQLSDTLIFKKGFLCLNGISWISVCAHHLMSFHWVPLRMWLCLYILPSDIYTHG